MKLKIALYRDTSYPEGFQMIREASKEPYMGSSDIRVSDYVEVDFPIDQEAMDVAVQAQAMQAARKDLLDNFKKKLEGRIHQMQVLKDLGQADPKTVQ